MFAKNFGVMDYTFRKKERMLYTYVCFRSAPFVNATAHPKKKLIKYYSFLSFCYNETMSC